MSLSPPRDTAVSEIVGALLLIAIVSLAVAIVWVTILSSVNTSEIPSLSIVISNQSRSISILHDGGDPLPAGSYRIYVDDADRTMFFSPDPGTSEFRTGTVLYSDGQFLPPGQGPGTAMVVYRGSAGKEAVLIQKYFS